MDRFASSPLLQSRPKRAAPFECLDINADSTLFTLSNPYKNDKPGINKTTTLKSRVITKAQITLACVD